MDKSWVDKDPASLEYEEGLNAFLDYAYIHGKLNREGNLKCPCTDCKNFVCQERSRIVDDLVCYGMLPSYTNWIHHGERSVSTPAPEIRNEDVEVDTDVDADGIRIRDDLSGLLGDAFPNEVDNMENMQDGTEDVNLNFKKLLEQSKKEFYPGCDKMTVLSFVIRLWHIKCINQLSNKAFTMMLQLARDSFPDGCSLPKNFTQCKKIITDLGMGYNKIDACRNDCMLFWKDDSKLDECNICGASRWKIVRPGKKKNTPWKILRHFPLKPRLQRLFMSSKTAKDMRWHKEEITNDRVMRHPADSIAGSILMKLTRILLQI
ncbi:uncharacterized protein LOC113306051 [Papaver somniferum]|uniref:uncharacterized protein LOC113306051 n=1 Tax=Papaver somniferum TaxID=3469 RepID=UPI000E6F5E79|nr:uncharacterized protein LOC113306051 [Papaver somniferum]